MQRTFYMGTDVEGNRIQSVVIQEPQQLLHGKSAWAQAACVWNSSPSLRCLGHSGAALSVYTFDRACIGALERLIRKRHRLEASQSTRQDRVAEGLLDFVLVVGDPMHDAANAFEWGIAEGHLQIDQLDPQRLRPGRPAPRGVACAEDRLLGGG